MFNQKSVGLFLLFKKLKLKCFYVQYNKNNKTVVMYNTKNTFHNSFFSLHWQQNVQIHLYIKVYKTLTYNRSEHLGAPL